MKIALVMGVLSATLAAFPCGTAGAAEADSVHVELVFGMDVDRETRDIVGEAEVFAPDVERVFCLTKVWGLAGETAVTHAWYHEGVTRARVDLPVRGGHWRTWSSKRILPAWTGAWEVKVLDADGSVLASASFEIR